MLRAYADAVERVADNEQAPFVDLSQVAKDASLRKDSIHLNEQGYKATAKAFPTEACAACHQASAADDMVFTQYYPVLRAAKGSKK